jgi:hypothetical protein
MTKKRFLGCLRAPPGVRAPPVEYLCLNVFQILIRKILILSSIPPTCPRCLCWQDCQRALVDESGVLPSRHNHRHHHGPPCSHITRGMSNRLVGGRSSDTQSHLIINQWSTVLSFSVTTDLAKHLTTWPGTGEGLSRKLISQTDPIK